VAIGSAFAACLIGLLISYHFDLPSGPAIILTAGAGYLLSTLVGRRGGVLTGAAMRTGTKAPAMNSSVAS
jgi:zinc/manganese transport system permease protein